jgi:hypothetical protein
VHRTNEFAEEIQQESVENASAVKFPLSDAEVKEISDVVDKHGVIGGRYFNAPAEVLNLWG